MKKEEILNKIIEIYKNIIGDEIDEKSISFSTRIKEDLGINSVGILYLILEIENEFNVVLHNETLDKFKTLDDVCSFILKNL